jgi:hypothetical protein
MKMMNLYLCNKMPNEMFYSFYRIISHIYSWGSLDMDYTY